MDCSVICANATAAVRDGFRSARASLLLRSHTANTLAETQNLHQNMLNKEERLNNFLDRKQTAPDVESTPSTFSVNSLLCLHRGDRTVAHI